MPLVLPTQEHEETFHYIHIESVDGQWPVFRDLPEAKAQPLQYEALRGDLPLDQRNDYTVNDIKGIPNGESILRWDHKPSMD